MNKIIAPILLIILVTLGVMGCKNKRISYTEMVKRESKEIKAFMDKKGFVVIDNLPADLKMKPNEFFEVKNDANVGLGVYINVITPGSNLKDMAVSDETSVSTRFSYTVIGDRMTAGLTSYSNIDPTDSAEPAATFIYQANINSDFQQGNFPPAPNSTVGEEQMSSFVCNAMMLALKYVPMGSTLKMITSFREGPSFTFKIGSSFKSDNEVGVALYYDRITFSHKK